MKRTLLRVALCILVGPFIPATVYGGVAFICSGCIPTYDLILLWYTGCQDDRTIYKVERAYVSFPDTALGSVDIPGWGCCHPTSGSLHCDPKYNTPITSTGHWEQLVIDQRCTTNPCAGGLCCSDLNARLGTVDHVCAASSYDCQNDCWENGYYWNSTNNSCQDTPVDPCDENPFST